MSAVELIGFAVSLLSLLFLFFRNRRQLSGQGEVEEDSQEGFLSRDPVQAFLKAMEEEHLKREIPPLPPPTPRIEEKKLKKRSKDEALTKNQRDKHPLPSSLDKRQLISPLAKPHEVHDVHDVHGVEILSRPPRVGLLIERLSDLKDLVVFKEIVDKPKSLRPWE